MPKKARKSLAQRDEIEKLERQVADLKKKAGLTEVDLLKARLLSFTRSRTEGGTWSILDLARKLDAKVPALEEAIASLKAESYDIDVKSGTVERMQEAPPGGLSSHYWRLNEGGWLRFGVLGDNQIGNRHSRLDVARTAYEHFKAEGIDTVYHTGNLIDGYHPKINAFELVPESGTSMESQVQYAGQVYPKAEGIKTYFITGECHEGWWSRRFGVNIGRFMQDNFERQGRTDLIYLGHEEADIEIRTPNLAKKTRGPIVRLIHPGGGTAYALSYKTQKMAESLQSGEKPAAQFVGHYHKYDVNYHREIYNLQTGCFPGPVRVSTPNGERPISSLKAGDEVITHLGRVRRVTQVFTHKWADRFATVRYGRETGGWCSVTGTINHPALVRRHGKLEQVPFGDLTTEDRVLVATGPCMQCGKPRPHYRNMCDDCNPSERSEVRAKIATAKTKHGLMAMKTRRASRGVGRIGTNLQHFEDRIMPQAKALEDQGFRVFPMGRVIPDLIAIRDGKAYAVEVESSRTRPDYAKYDRTGMGTYYDDIMWVLPSRTGPKTRGLPFFIDEETRLASVPVMGVTIKDRLRADRSFETVHNLEVEEDHSFMAGGMAVHNCLQDQSMFMRKHSIPAHVGYLTVEAFVAKDGTVSRWKHEWVPFYDKGYFQRYETW